MIETLELLKDDSNYYGELGRTYLSNSDVKVLLSNPALFKQDTPDNLAFAKGRYFHQLILEPSKAEDTTFVDCNTRTTKVYKQHLEDTSSSFALLSKEGEEMRECVSKMLSNLDFFDMIREDGAEYEVPAIGEVCGHMFKGKADIVGSRYLYDLKTTSKIEDFKWSARRYGYDSQAYIYEQLFGKPLVFLVVDKVTKQLGMFVPTEEFLARGEEKVVKAIEVYNKFFSEEKTQDLGSYYIREEL